MAALSYSKSRSKSIRKGKNCAAQKRVVRKTVQGKVAYIPFDSRPYWVKGPGVCKVELLSVCDIGVVSVEKAEVLNVEKVEVLSVGKVKVLSIGKVEVLSIDRAEVPTQRSGANSAGRGTARPVLLWSSTDPASRSAKAFGRCKNLCISSQCQCKWWCGNR